MQKCYGINILEGQADDLGISNYLSKIENYIDTDIDIKDMFSNVIQGNTNNLKQKILKIFCISLGDEFKNCLVILVKIIAIALISAILSNLTNSFGESTITEIAFFIIYITIIILTMSNFNSILLVIKNAIEQMSNFMYISIPVVFTLMLTTGNVTTTSIFQPLLLGAINLISIFINKLIIPAILVITVLNIVSNINNKDQLKKLSAFIKSITIWIIGLGLTILVGIMSLEGSLSSSIDGITAKTTKAAVTTFIPVVGKVLGDAVDTVLGSVVVLKNAVGLIGVFIVLIIAILPIIKTSVLMGMLYFTSAVISPIVDVRITKSIDTIADSIKILLGVLITIAFIYIISITLVIKISNISMTFR